MEAFTSVSFSGKIDSKGRVTIPARIRNRLEMEKGDKVSLSLESCKAVRKEFSSIQKALEFVSKLQGVKSFSFDSGMLEVVLRD